MSSSSGPLAEILAELDEIAAAQHWDQADTELDLLNEEIVEALIERRDDDIRMAAERVERLYSRLAVRLGNTSPPSQAMLCGRLKGLSGLLIVATRHRRAPTADAMLSDQTVRRILTRLGHDDYSTGDLARWIERREETVARKLPGLRAAGLVQSWKAGRLMVNALTEAGRNLLASADALPAQQAGQFVKLSDEESKVLTAAMRGLSRPVTSEKSEAPASGPEDNVLCFISGKSDRASGSVTFQYLKGGRDKDEVMRRLGKLRQRVQGKNVSLDGKSDTDSPSLADLLGVVLSGAHRTADD